VNELMLGTNDQFIASLEKVRPGCAADEYLNYKRAIGAVVYEVFERILEPLYLKHPELRPPELEERSPS
jgi:hypothetical protein